MFITSIAASINIFWLFFAAILFLLIFELISYSYAINIPASTKSRDKRTPRNSLPLDESGQELFIQEADQLLSELSADYQRRSKKK